MIFQGRDDCSRTNEGGGGGGGVPVTSGGPVVAWPLFVVVDDDDDDDDDERDTHKAPSARLKGSRSRQGTNRNAPKASPLQGRPRVSDEVH